MACEVASSAWFPKVMVPMQRSETTIALRPRRFFLTAVLPLRSTASEDTGRGGVTP
jgi:hypothetical protein